MLQKSNPGAGKSGLRTTKPLAMKKGMTGVLMMMALLWASCGKESSYEGEAYTLKIHFRPSANGDSLVMGQSYLNPQGEDYSVSTFKFYVSHIQLLDELPEAVARDQQGIYLVDATDPATKTITVKLNSAPFTRVSFQLGVDSIYNVSGAQDGALDPTRGMFWTWNTGYIMAKLEGNSSFSSAPNQALTYHIGGFQGANATQRTITLDLPQQQSWRLEENTITEITIDADLDKWFLSAHSLPIGLSSGTMTPGPLAAQYADNYASMFRIDRIERTK